MNYVFHKVKSLILVLSIFLFMAPGLPHALAQNGFMMQYFHWYYPAGGLLWDEVAGHTDELAAVGITALWLPPAFEGTSQNDVGYGVYDLYEYGNDIWIQAWTGFDFPKRSDTYSSFWGQNVYVVGSIPELGDWDPDKARILGS